MSVKIKFADPVFTYFDRQLQKPNWQGKKVLDFGGNSGNVLRDDNCKIIPSNYYCIDVSKEAIEKGKADYPTANWLFYNRFNFSYNPTGIPNLEVPDTGQRFDYILAYSVFTHTTKDEMVELITYLSQLLVPGGYLAFTFYDLQYKVPLSQKATIENHTPLYHALKRRGNSPEEISVLLKDVNGANWCSLSHYNQIDIETDNFSEQTKEQMINMAMEDKYKWTAHNIYFTSEYMKILFPNGTIYPPYDPFMTQQHCCIING